MRRLGSGFTLVELMVSMAILVLLLVVLVSITDATRKTWSYTSGKIEQFHDAREAFESITRKLSQATLNTYWDYDNPLTPTRYLRQSELRFISGDATTLTGSSTCPTHAVFFQAPLGYAVDTTRFSDLDNLLNTWGYYVQFGSDKPSWPPFIQNMGTIQERYRFRVMELMEPSDSLTLYTYTSGTNGSGAAKNLSYNTIEWFTTPFNGTSPYTAATRPVRVLAENIIALVLLPKLTSGDQAAGNPAQSISSYTDASLAPSYLYDSTVANSDNCLNTKNQLPAVVQVTMVAVDEMTYGRYQSMQPAGVMPSDLGLSSLFKSVGSTTDASVPGYAQDLQTLQNTLTKYKINYRVFTTNVSLKTAKWSRAQTN